MLSMKDRFNVGFQAPKNLTISQYFIHLNFFLNFSSLEKPKNKRKVSGLKSSIAFSSLILKGKVCVTTVIQKKMNIQKFSIQCIIEVSNVA